MLIGLLPVFGQTQSSSEATLQVTVRDPNQAAIVGALVQLTPSTGPAQALSTNQRGEAVFSRLNAGPYQVLVTAAGFEPYQLEEVKLRAGRNELEARLPVAKVTEEVAVGQEDEERRTDPKNPAFATVLTKEQIEQLPDDPDELEETLKQMAGPGATIRVNGFSGGKLPPKSQIKDIRFRMNPYSAEFHNEGFFGVDITTKPGTDAWHGNFDFGFRDEALNARPAFAPRRGAEQLQRFGLSLEIPIKKDQTALFLHAESAQSYDSKTIVTALPDGPFADVTRRPTRGLNLSARLEHGLSQSHTLYSEYQRNARRQDNLGVGDFNLAERAYTMDLAEHVFRLRETGLLTPKLLNEFRFQVRWQEVEAQSAVNSPAIIVLNAFSRGGAGIQNQRQAQEIEVADNLDFVWGKHSLRTGAQFEAARYRSNELQNGNGTFTFASLAEFHAQRPLTYTQRTGATALTLTQYQFGSYLQDDWRARKNLSLSLGLRYEAQTNFRDQQNLAPRLGLAWSPSLRSSLTVRAGGGIFYDWYGAAISEQSLRVNGRQQSEIVILKPGFPDPTTGQTGIRLPPSRITTAEQMSLPYLTRASAGIEQQLFNRFRLMANYNFERGVHLLRGRNINAPQPGLGRPDPTAGNITQVESTANSTRHALNLGLGEGRFTPRLMWFLNYTLAKTTNEADGPFALPADNFKLAAERGPAALDARHRFFAMLNLGLFKGIRLGTMFFASSALPYNITTGFDNNGDSIINDRPAGVGRNSARGAEQWNVNMSLSWSYNFGEARQAESGRMRVRTFRADGDNVGGGPPMMPGMSPKRYRLDFYLQAFNLFNHVNPTNFSGVQTSPFFGQATAAQPGRRLETGMKFRF